MCESSWYDCKYLCACTFIGLLPDGTNGAAQPLMNACNCC
jgi:hypothetical protein